MKTSSEESDIRDAANGAGEALLAVGDRGKNAHGGSAISQASAVSSSAGRSPGGGGDTAEGEGAGGPPRSKPSTNINRSALSRSLTGFGTKR